MIRHAHVLLGITIGLGCLPAACGSKKPADNPQLALSASVGGSAASSGPSAATSGQPGPSATASGSAAPLASVFTTDPNQLAALLAAAAAAGSAMMQNGGVPGDPAEAGLRAATAKHAGGMAPEGQLAKGTLQPDGHSQFFLTMAPGKCYSIVGFSPAGQITNLDLNLLAPPFYTMLAGQDGMSDNTAVIGKAPQPMCPLVPFAVPYKVDIHARQGGGAFAVQVLSKTK